MIVQQVREMRRTFGKTGMVIAASVLLAGCVSLGGGGDPPEQLITLTPDATAPAGDFAGGAVSSAIVVLDPDTDRRLDVTRVPVQIDTSSLAYLEDAVWVEKPARQFRRLLAETIRAKGGRVVVEGSDVEVAGKTFLSGRLIDMGYDAQVQAVVVRYDGLLEGEGGTIRSRRFEAEVVAIPAEASAVAPALNEAANDVAAQVADWVVGGG